MVVVIIRARRRRLRRVQQLLGEQRRREHDRHEHERLEQFAMAGRSGAERAREREDRHQPDRPNRGALTRHAIEDKRWKPASPRGLSLARPGPAPGDGSDVRLQRHRREGPAAIATVTILNAEGDFRFDVR